DVEIDGDSLVCGYNTRQYQVYEEREDGSYSEELTKVVGPERDGFVIRVTQTKLFDHGWHNRLRDGPYWRLYRRMHYMTTKENYLQVEVKFGRAYSYEFMNEVFATFGEEN